MRSRLSSALPRASNLPSNSRGTDRLVSHRVLRAVMSLLSNVATMVRTITSKEAAIAAGTTDDPGEAITGGTGVVPIIGIVAAERTAAETAAGAFIDKNFETVTASHSVVVSDSR